MSHVNVSAELLEKQARYISEVNPQIEKIAAEHDLFSQQAPALVDAMIAQGVVRADSRDAAVAELASGGLAKAAEVIQYLTSIIEPRRLGGADTEKRASALAARPGQKDSDRLFEELVLK